MISSEPQEWGKSVGLFKNSLRKLSCFLNPSLSEILNQQYLKIVSSLF